MKELLLPLPFNELVLLKFSVAHLPPAKSCGKNVRIQKCRKPHIVMLIEWKQADLTIEFRKIILSSPYRFGE